MIDYKYPTIASGATRIGSAERAPDRINDKDEEGYKPLNISTIIKLRLRSRQNIERLLPSGVTWEKLIRNSLIFYQSNLTATCDSRVTLSQRNSNAVIYHEGKTPGSVLCGPVYAHGCALLVCIRVYDAKKILVDALGTLRITGIYSL
jgi:hypothetical protein